MPTGREEISFNARYFPVWFSPRAVNSHVWEISIPDFETSNKVNVHYTVIGEYS